MLGSIGRNGEYKGNGKFRAQDKTIDQKKDKEETHISSNGVVSME
jgi:hypothetical protein